MMLLALIVSSMTDGQSMHATHHLDGDCNVHMVVAICALNEASMHIKDFHVLLGAQKTIYHF